MPEQGPILDPSMALVVRVDPGDTFASVAAQFGVDESALRAQHPHGPLAPGEELLVPVDATLVRTDPGDTWNSVAKQFGTTPARIKDANPDVDTITPGTTLIIP